MFPWNTSLSKLFKYFPNDNTGRATISKSYLYFPFAFRYVLCLKTLSISGENMYFHILSKSFCLGEETVNWKPRQHNLFNISTFFVFYTGVSESGVSRGILYLPRMFCENRKYLFARKAHLHKLSFPANKSCELFIGFRTLFESHPLGCSRSSDSNSQLAKKSNKKHYQTQFQEKIDLKILHITQNAL